MNTSPSLSPPGSDLDGLELESLRASRDHAPGTSVALKWHTMWDAPQDGTVVWTFGTLHADGIGETAGVKRSWFGKHGWECAELGGHEPTFWAPISSSEQVEVPKSRDELLSQISQLEAELKRRDAVAAEAWGDQADEHTAAISAAHPMRSQDHDTFSRALAMVGKRHGKYELVGLVNWLLAELKRRDEAMREALDAVSEARACFHVGRRDDVKSYSLVKSAWAKLQAVDDAHAALQPQEDGDA